RQSTFGSRSTTDDHLMHLVGIAHDADGKKYYLIKNSWGDVGKHNGYLYMSEPYLRLKTVAVLLHKDALPSKSDETKPKT
ncbi:MAG: C1 family peptidase, partial [Mariniblastus sp.]|nr:C1 family peptidase [Mariniblastus sp.]